MKKLFSLSCLLLALAGCANKPYLPWETHLDEMEREVAPDLATTQKFNIYMKMFVPKMRFFYSKEKQLWIAIAPEKPLKADWIRLNNRVFSSTDGINFTQEISRPRAFNEDSAVPYYIKMDIKEEYEKYDFFYCSNAYTDDHRELIVRKTLPEAPDEQDQGKSERPPAAYSFGIIGLTDEYEYREVKRPPKLLFKSMPVTMVKRNLLQRPSSNQYFLMEQRKYNFHPTLRERLDLKEYHLLSGPPDMLYPFDAVCISIEGKHYFDEISFTLKCGLGTLIANEQDNDYEWMEYKKTIRLKRIQPYDYYLKRDGQYTQIGWVE